MRRRSAVVAVLAVLSLLASACGARLSDAQQVAARNQLGVGSVGGGAGTATRSAGSGSAGTGGVASDTGAAGADTTGGAGPAGATGTDGGQGGAAAAGSGAACTPQPGAKDPGITDTEITFGNVSTITGPIPGFGESGRSGARAYLNYLNATKGGICGRKASIVFADDRLDAGTNRSETQRLMSSVFGFVGSTTVVDDGGTAVLNGTDVSNCSLVIGSASIASANAFSPNPIDPSGTTNGTSAIWAWLKANMGVTKVAVIWPAQTDARTRGQAYIPDIQSAGLAVDGPYEVAITETNYAGVANKIKTSGADAVITTLEINGMARLAQAFDQVGYKPKVPFYGAQAYGTQLIKQAGAAAEGTTLGLTHAIFEDAGSNPAMAAFVEWYKRTNPGVEPDFFAVMGWAAADMMAQAVEAAGPVPTRAAVLQQLQGMRSFDAHGMLAPRDPGGKKGATQFIIARVEGGQWKRVYPDSGFAG